jgi:hypothetical protein
MTTNTAAFTILYDGWLLAQNRVTTQVFNSVMDKYDERWAKPEDRQKVVAAAHYTGCHARTQDVVLCHAAAMTLLWWLFRSGEYKGTHQSWHAERDLYRDLLPAINSRKIDLLDHPRLLTQLVGLERRTARGGRDSIDHAPGAHDDLANAVAGLCGCTRRKYAYDCSLSWVS